MPGPLPIPLRQRVVKAYLETGGYNKIARRFNVAVNSVRRWVAIYSQDENVKPKPHAGGPAPKIKKSEFQELIVFTATHSDAVIPVLAQKWGEKKNIEIHTSSMSRALRKAGLSYKKKFPGSRARS